MVQEHFLRAIETGLREEAVRAKLRPYLQTCNIEDDELIAKVTRVCAEESERDSKLGKQRVKVARVESKGKCSSESLMEKPISNQCLTTLNAVQLQLKELSSEVCELRKGKTSTSTESNNQPPLGKRGCSKCQEDNKRDSCDHCYSCGEVSHFWMNCPKLKTIQNTSKGFGEESRSRPKSFSNNESMH